MPSLLLALSALALHPQPCGIVRESVERVEINAVCQAPPHDGDAGGVLPGTVSLTQVVFWDGRDEESGSPTVLDWKMLRADMAICGDRLVWLDGSTIRDVRFRSLVRSWTEHDVEVENRTVLATEKRRKLGGGK